MIKKLFSLSILAIVCIILLSSCELILSSLQNTTSSTAKANTEKSTEVQKEETTSSPEQSTTLSPSTTPKETSSEIPEIGTSSVTTPEMTTQKPVATTPEVTTQKPVVTPSVETTTSKPSHSHSPEIIPAVSPSCTEPGLTEGLRCSECKEILKAQTEIKAKGHAEIIDKAVVPTCVNEGLTQGKHCSACNTVLIAQSKIPPTGKHTEAKDKAVPPTCITDGLTEGSHCSVCKTVLISQTVIKSNGTHTEEIIDSILPSGKNMGTTSGLKCSACGEVFITPTEVSRFTLKYGYEFLGTLENGNALQKCYERLLNDCLKFHLDETLDAVFQKAQNRYIASETTVADLKLTIDQINIVRTIFFEDNQHLFYWIANKYSYSYYPDTGFASKLVTLANKNFANGSARREMNLKLYKTVQSFASEGINAYEKAKDYHDDILKNIKYALDENGFPKDDIWAHNVTGYILYGEGVCEAYTEIFSLVMNYNGIPCLRVVGTVENEDGSLGRHAWNMAQMEDGNWYWFDLTYDDYEGGFHHTFFCVNDNQTLSNGQHFLDRDLHIFDTPETPSVLYTLPPRSEKEYKTE